MDSTQWKKLFNSVWSNMILFKLIQKYSKLYAKNESVLIKDRTDLLKRKDQLEYIRKIRYSGDTMFENGDLPNNGVLKEIRFEGTITKPINGKIIPYGVEIVDLWSRSRIPTLFSTYPSTVHTIKHATACDNHGNYDGNDFKMESISFGNCTNLLDIPYSIESNGNHFKLPNTIKELTFPNDWNNNGLPLSTGVLPNSIKELEILSGLRLSDNGNNDDCEGLFNVLPVDIEKLVLHISSKCVLSSNSNLEHLCKSLKELTIITDTHLTVKDNTLPTSVTYLSVYGVTYLDISFPAHIKKLTLISNCGFIVSPGYFPNSLEYLETNVIFRKPNVFPTTLTHLKINSGPIQSSKEDEELMLSLLPPSVTTITFPKYYSNLKFKNIPKTVKNIKYFD